MNSFRKLAGAFLFLVLLAMTGAVSAEEGGGKEAAGSKDVLHAKVAPIIVNLMGATQQYIQVEMIFKLAKPEVDERVKTYMPVIRSKMILLLSSKSAEQLNSTEGKNKLVQESKDAVNQAIERTDKDGVTEVLFDSFIIQ